MDYDILTKSVNKVSVYLTGMNLIQMCLCWNWCCLTSVLRKLFEESQTFARVQLSYIAVKQPSQQKPLLWGSQRCFCGSCPASQNKCLVPVDLSEWTEGRPQLLPTAPWHFLSDQHPKLHYKRLLRPSGGGNVPPLCKWTPVRLVVANRWINMHSCVYFGDNKPQYFKGRRS